MASEAKRTRAKKTKKRRVEAAPALVAKRQVHFARLPRDVGSSVLKSLDVKDVYAFWRSHKGAEEFVRGITHLHANKPKSFTLAPVWRLAAGQLQSIWLSSPTMEDEWSELFAASKQLRSVTLHELDRHEVIAAFFDGLATSTSRSLTALDVSAPEPLPVMDRLDPLVAAVAPKSAQWVKLSIDWAAPWAHRNPSDAVWDLAALQPGPALRELTLPITATDRVLEILAGQCKQLETVQLNGAANSRTWTGAGVERFLAASRERPLRSLVIDGIEDDEYIPLRFQWDRDWKDSNQQWSMHQLCIGDDLPAELSDEQQTQCNEAVLDVRGAQWHHVHWWLDTPKRMMAALEVARRQHWTCRGSLVLQLARRHGKFKNWSGDDIRAFLERLPPNLPAVYVTIGSDESDQTIEWRPTTGSLWFWTFPARHTCQAWLQVLAPHVRELNGDMKAFAKPMPSLPKLHELDIGGWYLDWLNRDGDWAEVVPVERLARVLRDSPDLVSVEFGERAYPRGALATLADQKAPSLRHLSLAVQGPVAVDELHRWSHLTTLRIASDKDTTPTMSHTELRRLVASMPAVERLGLDLRAAPLGHDTGGAPWVPPNTTTLTTLQLRLDVGWLMARDLMATFAACPRLTLLDLFLDTPAEAKNPPESARPTLDQLRSWVREAKLDAKAPLTSIELRRRRRDRAPGLEDVWVTDRAEFKGRWNDGDLSFLRHWQPFLIASADSTTSGSSSSSLSLQSRTPTAPHVHPTASLPLPVTSEAELNARVIARDLAARIHAGERVVIEGTTARATVDTHGVLHYQPQTPNPDPRTAAELLRFDGRKLH